MRGDLGPVCQRIVNLLKQAKGGTVPRDVIWEAIYGTSPDSPDDERRAMNRLISTMRAKGVDIECVITYRLRGRA